MDCGRLEADNELSRTIRLTRLTRLIPPQTKHYPGTHEHDRRENKAEQNGCKQKLVWHQSCEQRFPPAVA